MDCEQPLGEALGTATMRLITWIETITANKTADEVKALVKDGEEEARVESDSDNSDIE
jgi:hypothetical protein